MALYRHKYLLAKDFVLKGQSAKRRSGLPAMSLFSGAGLSDLGYQEAGFNFVLQVEKDSDRANLCKVNFQNSKIIIGDVKEKSANIIKKYRTESNEQLVLLTITPPCQGMSSSNPSRGKASEAHNSDERNILLLETLPIIQSLKPKIIVVENVPQLFNRMVKYKRKSGKLFDLFTKAIGERYFIFSNIVQMADYGVPQDRKRAVLIAVRNDQPFLDKVDKGNLSLLPIPTHKKQPSNGHLPWITLSEWLLVMKYRPLDAKSKETSSDELDPLHNIPTYDHDRYMMVAGIPANSGKSAYQNSDCLSCGKNDVPEGKAYCPACSKPLLNRPFVKIGKKYRLIKGFASSYRRMYPDRPSATITTASSHIGSDYKIHPWENRVLSMRECADLQTVPRKYDFSLAFQINKKYLIRQVVGEALPPWFTYQHGLILKRLLNDSS